jgi:site-specific recombinase XerD
MERRAHRGAGRVTVASAVRAYLAEREARHLSRPSLRQSRAFLDRQFLRWCKNRGLLFLDEIRTWQIREFRHTWDFRTATAIRRHERLCAFFVFCVSNGWLPANPMERVKRHLVRRAHPTDYFNRREFKRIAEATNEYEYGGGVDCWHRARRMRALVLLMRWSGLAIKYAVTLEQKALDAPRALFLARQTGVPVFVPLPPVVVASLRTLPSANPVYFFWEWQWRSTERCAGLRAQLPQTFSHR